MQRILTVLLPIYIFLNIFTFPVFADEDDSVNQGSVVPATGNTNSTQTNNTGGSLSCSQGNCSACTTQTISACGNQNAYAGDCDYATKCKNNPNGKYTCKSRENPNGCYFDQYDCSACNSSVTGVGVIDSVVTTPQPATDMDRNYCASDCGKCTKRYNYTLQEYTYDTCIDDKGSSNIDNAQSFCKNGATKFRCFASGNKNCVSDLEGSYSYSCQPVNTSPGTEPVSSPTPKPLTLASVLLDISTASKTTLGVNFTQNIALPFADLTKESDLPAKFDVTYSDGSTRSFFLTFKYKPKNNAQPTNGSTNNYTVDFWIDTTSPDLDERKRFVTDSIKYINEQYQKYGVNKQLQLGSFHYYKNGDQCPDGSENSGKVYVDFASCSFPKNNIIIVFVKNTTKEFTGEAGLASVSNATIVLNRTADETVALHEVNHLFGLDDVYKRVISAEDNPVSHQAFSTKYPDVMMTSSAVKDNKIPALNKISINLLNSQVGLYSPDLQMWVTKIPKNIILEFKNKDGSVMKNTTVEIFPGKSKFFRGNTLDTKPEVSFITGGLGQSMPLSSSTLFLNGKNTEEVFESGAPAMFSLIKTTSNTGEVRYFWLEIGDAVIKFFDGETESTVIQVTPESLTNNQNRKVFELTVKLFGQKASTNPDGFDKFGSLFNVRFKEDGKFGILGESPRLQYKPAKNEYDGSFFMEVKDEYFKKYSAYLFIEGSSYLRQRIFEVSIGQENKYVFPVVTLYGGDLNHDNSINSIDYELLQRCIDKKLQDNECDSKNADLNLDGYVDNEDLGVLKTNLGKKADDYL